MMECRLHQLQGMAGTAAPDEEALNALIEGDFDPEEYDRRMAAAFGDDYYGVSCAVLLSACRCAASERTLQHHASKTLQTVN